MTSSSEEEEAEVPRVAAILVHYLKAVMRSLPPFTAQLVVIFCLLPVATAVSLFLLTATINFGVALIAQTISSVAVLIFLVPCLSISLIFAVATAYVLQIAQMLYLRLFYVPDRKTVEFPAEIEEKLKLL